MRYAIFGDIHSNIEALNALFGELIAYPGIQLVCLGDIVGYSASPNRCVQLIRESRIMAVMGNHDCAIFNEDERNGFNSAALQAIEWQEKMMTHLNRGYLQKLPYTRVIDGVFSITHADFSNPEEFLYVMTPMEAAQSMAQMETSIGFFGHTHIPTVFTQGKNNGLSQKIRQEQMVKESFDFTLSKENRYLINPGSVGQPRDGNVKGSYMVYDSDRMLLSFRRFDYNFKQEAQRIRDANLPAMLAERLHSGV
ncbi:hypothetical protein GF373_14120 [bacterium]|nr:hypothetical protein [bacterium]